MSTEMKLKVLLPTGVFLVARVSKAIAEAANGSFCLLPNHIDFVATLVPGILSFDSGGDGEVFLAIDRGVLVKCGSEVLVATRQAIRGDDLDTLMQAVEERFLALDERERRSRSALAKLEASFVRGLAEMRGIGNDRA
ncbi:F0F1 ATP synthase subunit epsilon [Synechococcus sp. PCC 7336]|uniref:F0F1 ATP synthase subunit epsilon n=1 Tax=Synechococcus sp. PCC 7336 TaxID=195250 RepID=UPI000347C0E7|nr:F0F1 ATP synthase subunit epsilon [Synechococcus sp. PCC 7336]